MKKTIIFLFTIVSLVIFSSDIVAQNPIPSYNVPVIADPTSFEEPTNNNCFSIPSPFGPFSQNTGSRAEKELVIKAKDNNTSTTATVVVEIYTLSEGIIYGPYTVYEDNPFTIFLNDNYEWGVRVLNASSLCEMDVYFQ